MSKDKDKGKAKGQAQAMADCIAHDFGDVVYHRTENEQKGIVCGIVLRPGTYVYIVQWSTSECGEHYGFELTTEPYGDPEPKKKEKKK